MDNKWATVGGVMTIISGSFAMIGGIVLMFFAVFFSQLLSWAGTTSGGFGPTEQDITTLVGLMYGVMGFFLLVLGVLALIGGIYCVRRRLWGLALAGAIAATLSFFPVGVIAVVFTALARPEFYPAAPSHTPVLPSPAQ